MALGATNYLARMIQNLKNLECFLTQKKIFILPFFFPPQGNSVFVTFHQPREVNWSQWWGKVTHKIFWNTVFGVSFKSTAKILCNVYSLESWIHAYLSAWKQKQALGVVLVRPSMNLSFLCWERCPSLPVDGSALLLLLAYLPGILTVGAPSVSDFCSSSLCHQYPIAWNSSHFWVS